MGLRLLEHDLGHEDGPRIACVPPREVAQTRDTPREHGSRVERSGSLPGGVDVVRTGARGANSRFQTITLRRK
jgi:hypothetical protein